MDRIFKISKTITIHFTAKKTTTMHHHLLAVIFFLASLPYYHLVASWRIESATRLQEQDRRTPPNTVDPDYFHPTSTGGTPGQSGHDGAVVFVAKVHTSSSTNPTHFEIIDVPPLELSATYLLKENVAQEYVVPGDGRQRPYGQVVKVKLWGGGGGGCDGGK